MPTFNNEASLRAFPKFRTLDDGIQSTVLQMLKDDRLNNHGGLKRPPNAWLVFRSDLLVANPEMKTMSQAEVTVMCRSRWAVATHQERLDAQARAQQAYDRLLEYFPDYTYKPMSTGDKERWKDLGPHQKKDFWLASAVRIAERIVDPSKQWDGFLTLEKWAEKCTPVGTIDTMSNPSPVDSDKVHSLDMEQRSTSPPPLRLVSGLRVRKPSGNCVDTADSTTDPSNTTSSRFHPYGRNPGLPIENQEKQHAHGWSETTSNTIPPGPLRDVLVHIGPQTSNTQRRRLVLSMFQLRDKTIWVSEDVGDDVPDNVFEQLSNSLRFDETSPNQLVLRDYSDPWIPEAINQNGEPFYPDIDSVSEYHEYMAAYYFAQENSSDFIWPPLQPPCPTLPPPSPHKPSSTPMIGTVKPIAYVPIARSTNLLVHPPFDFTKTSPPGVCESLPSNRISDSDSDSVTTPEENLDWDESMPIDIMEFDHGELEGFEFKLE